MRCPPKRVKSTPTGSEDNFTGQGTWKFSPRLLFSTQGTRVNAHLNLGVTVAQSKINDKFNYSFGVEWAVTKPVTLSAEVQGNYEINNRRISLSALLKGTQDLAASDDHQFVAGAKWNLWRKVLIGATFSIPLNDTGLQWGISGGMTAEASF